MEDICKITTYVTDASYRDLVYPVLARHMPAVYPCSTGVVVSALGKPYADFEIDVFAVIPEGAPEAQTSYQAADSAMIVSRSTALARLASISSLSAWLGWTCRGGSSKA